MAGNQLLLKAVERKYKVKFRKFQEAVYLKILQGYDVFVFAPTGSGKTCCFAFQSELFCLAYDADGNDNNRPNHQVAAIVEASALLRRHYTIIFT